MPSKRHSSVIVPSSPLSRPEPAIGENSVAAVFVPPSFLYPMAPPRRHTKKGDTRMDAALDAMRQFGFDQKVVRRSIRELLKVYDGEWSFMEEYAYKLLIDTIIDKQEAEAQTRLESPNGAATSAARELVVSDLPDQLNAMPLGDRIGPSEPNRGSLSPQVESPRYPRRNRRSKYAERVKKILGVKRTTNSSRDPPCKRRFCHGFLSDGEQDDLIDFEPRSTTSVPVALLLSRSKYA